MKDIEQVRMLVSLKGERIWLRGEVLDAPFHPEILREVSQNPDLVEILKRTEPPKSAQKQSEQTKEVDKEPTKRQLLSRRK